jgi:acyl dehydratase
MAPERAYPHGAPAIAATIVGVEVGPERAMVDARWLMAYAAGAGAHHARFFDTTGPAGPLAHPLFPVCYEWPLLLDLRAHAIGAAAPRGVHATHRLSLRRLPRAGDQLSTTARVTAVVPRRAGTLVVVSLVSRDEGGEVVSETEYGSLYRGVWLEGATGEIASPSRPRPAPGPARWAETLDVPYHLAHVYTECARIWNPIHTDVAVARAAGLPGPILHGTSTLALAVSLVLERELAGDAGSVRGIEARFAGMVPLPSTITVRATGGEPRAITFDVVAADGSPLIAEGVLRR